MRKWMARVARFGLGALGLTLACAAGPAAAGPPNLLLVVVDDLNCDVSCYGHPSAKTPNLDALAAAGVRFERAYAQVPSCNGSRTSFLTGRYPTATGVFDNTTSRLDALPDSVTLARHFRSHGYATARAGKIAHRGFGDADAWTFGEAEKPRRRRRRRAEQAARSTDRWAIEGGAEHMPDYRTAERAGRLLFKLRGAPFLLAVGLSTHAPFSAPIEYFSMHPWQQVELPGDFAETPPKSGPAFRPNLGLFFRRNASAVEARQMIAAYRAETSFVDAQLGRILDALDRLGLRDDTLVVVFSDHGFHLGEKGLWAKSTLFERATRVPLVVSGPGVAVGVSPRTVELVDLYPTLVELAGLPTPGVLDGQSLVPLLKDPSAAWNHPARSWLRRGEVLGSSVRTERYRYTQWSGLPGAAELYDHAQDPGEDRNLAAQAEQQERIAELRALLSGAP